VRVPTRFRISVALVLVGLLLAGSAPAVSSQEQAVEQSAKDSDDEREDSSSAAATTRDESPTAAPEATGTGDPAFNTLEDIVRLRAAAAILLAQCRPPSGNAPHTLTIAWRDVED